MCAVKWLYHDCTRVVHPSSASLRDPHPTSTYPWNHGDFRKPKNEFSYTIKTGLGAERLQLESAERLFAAIAIMSVVALRLIELRERLRRHPDAEAAQSGLSPLELEVLRQKSGRTLRTVREVALAIGRLGRHLNRTRDGLPGWQTLWHGMNTLHVLVEGVLMAHRLKGFG